MDHMRRGTLNLDGIRFFVLDEADEMLDMGFIEDIEWILEQAPIERQTALFSATMPPRIVDLAQRYLTDPERLTVAGKQMTVPETRQTSYEVPKARKVDALTRILDAETPPLAMIFCRTKLGVDDLGEALLARGYQVETLHGDLSQAQRDRVMRRFRSGQADILIATDVAARGLDIPDVTHVINYDIPESAEAYVHRIGRTGRAGRHGEAITLVTPRETRWLRQIERIVKARIEPKRLPTASDVAERRREVLKGAETAGDGGSEGRGRVQPVPGGGRRSGRGARRFRNRGSDHETVCGRDGTRNAVRSEGRRHRHADGRHHEPRRGRDDAVVPEHRA
jgi:ATP-dependent RNA helicase DeaD